MTVMPVGLSSPASSAASLPALDSVDTQTPVSSNRWSLMLFPHRSGICRSRLGNVEAAVDLERLAGQVAAWEVRWIRDGGPAMSPGRRSRASVSHSPWRYAALRWRPPRRACRGEDGSGRDGVDRIRGHRSSAARSGVVRERGLGGAVGDVRRPASRPIVDGDVDDAAATRVLEYQRDSGGGERVRGETLNVNASRRSFVEVFTRARASRPDVVDDDVCFPNVLDRLDGGLAVSSGWARSAATTTWALRRRL